MMRNYFIAGAAALAAVWVDAGALRAQDPAASARTLAIGAGHGALARGHEAIQWGSAALALPGGPRLSLAVLPTSASAGARPLSLREIAGMGDGTGTAEVRADWLERIRAAGSIDGGGYGTLTYLAASRGPLALRVSSTMEIAAAASPDAAELLFFGNAARMDGREGLVLRGSHVHAALVSAVELGYARRIEWRDDQQLALGATLRYRVGHGLIGLEDNGSVLLNEPASIILDLPMVRSESFGLASRHGGGFGLDVGAAWQRDGWTAVLAARDLVQTFRWDESALRYRAGAALLDGSGLEVELDEHPLADAPAHVRTALAGIVDAPPSPTTLTFSTARDARPDLTLSAGVRAPLSARAPAGRLSAGGGVGAEYRRFARVPLRAGFSATPDSYQLSTGLGLQLGQFSADLAGAFRQTERGPRLTGAFSLSVAQW